MIRMPWIWKRGFGNRPIDDELISMLANDGVTLAEITPILRRGADVNSMVVTRMGRGGPWPGETPLLIAVSYEAEAAVVKELLDRGADWQVRGVNGQTALHLAAFSARPEIVKLLLDPPRPSRMLASPYAWVPDKDGHPPMRQAILGLGSQRPGGMETVKLLLDGAPVVHLKACLELTMELLADNGVVTVDVGGGIMHSGLAENMLRGVELIAYRTRRLRDRSYYQSIISCLSRVLANYEKRSKSRA